MTYDSVVANILACKKKNWKTLKITQYNR
jgi:hypothetical protein